MTLSADDPRFNNLGYWSHDAAERHPDNIAMIDLSRTPAAEIAYRMLEERLDRVAAALTVRGLKPGDRMALAVGNRFEFVEIMYGAMRAGIVPVPLNTKLGADTLEYTIRDAGCRSAVVDPAVNPAIVAVVDGESLPVRIALDTPPPGWEDYDRVIAEAPCPLLRRASPTITRRFSPIRRAPPASRRAWCSPMLASSGGFAACRNTGRRARRVAPSSPCPSITRMPWLARSSRSSTLARAS